MGIKVRFLIVDDDKNIRRLCVTIGGSLGFACEEAENAEEALARLESDPPDLVLADLMMPQMSGLEFLEQVKKLAPRTEIAIMTGHGSIESAVRAMRMGAYDFITKPFRLEEMKLLLQRMEEKARLVAENEFLRDRVNADMELNGIIGSSTKIQDILRVVARLKDTRTPVLITGESGSGKELIARAIHYKGTYATRPFIAVDCGSLVPTLIESELFGYEKGAFTGAVKTKQGLFQAASGGTIFLDEIGELPLEMQAKLLRVLQEKEVRPVGSNHPLRVDVRIIAATNRDLESAIRVDDVRDKLADARARMAESHSQDRVRIAAEVARLQAELSRLPKIAFRKDLFYRLNVVKIHMPSLKERRSDVPVLVLWFLDKFAPGRNLAVTSTAMEAMQGYDWPGNVRELENCIERAVALGADQILDVEDLPSIVRQHYADAATHTGGGALISVSAPATSDLEEVEKATIRRVFEQVRGDKAAALKVLGISRATLYRKLKRYNIELGRKGLSASA